MRGRRLRLGIESVGEGQGSAGSGEGFQELTSFHDRDLQA
jgi:hypothetical protein